MIRKVFLTISILAIFFIFLLSSGLNLFSINEDLKELIVSKIRKVAGDSCSVKALSIGLGTIDVEDIKLAFHDSPYEISIEALKLDYSLSSLLRGGILSERTAEEITVHRPVLTIKYQEDSAPKPDIDLSLRLSSEAEEMYRSLIKEYDFIKRITISDGEIEIVKEDGSLRKRLAKKINGWAYTNDQSRIWLRLAGHIFDTDAYNMIMYGQLDLTKGAIDYINVDLHDYKFGSTGQILIPDYIEVQDGIIEGHLAIREKQNTHGFNIEGNVSLRDGSFKIASENLFFDDINIEAQINDWDIEIRKATQKINGSPTELTGRVENLLQPRLNLTLSSAELDVKRFLDRLFPEKTLPFQGHAMVNVKITDGLDSPVANGFLASNDLSFYSKKIDTIAVALSVNKHHLTFDKMSARFDSTYLNGSGKVDLASTRHNMNFDLDLDGEITSYLHDLGLREASSSHVQTQVRVFGPILSPVSNGSFDMSITGKKQPKLDMEGSYHYTQGRLVLHAASLTDGVQIDAKIDSIFTDPHVHFDAVNLQELVAFSNNPAIRLLQKEYALKVLADGKVDSVHISVNGFRKQNYERVFEATSIFLKDSLNNRVDNKLVLLPSSPDSVNGSFSLLLEEQRTRLVNLEIGNWLTGQFDFSTDSALDHRGKLKVSGFELPILLKLLGGTSDDYSGLLYGQISLEGICDEPVFSGELWLLEGFLNSVGPVKGQFVFRSDETQLNVKKLTMEDNEAFNLVARGDYNFKSEQVDAVIAGAHVQIEDILNLFVETKNVVTGDAMIQVALKGKAPELPLYGNIFLSNAKVLMLQFDEVAIDFGQPDASNGSYISRDFLNIGNLKVSKADEFSIQGPAMLPLKGDRQMNLSLSGEGNFLATLSDLAEVFTDSKSTGRLDLKLSGPYSKPNFSGSKVAFTDGELELNTVTKKIENLEADLEVRERDYFLDIKKLWGTIRETPFSITNTVNMSGLNHAAYDPLRIGGDNLNLGALLLMTSDKGVPLHIPGLMEKGETGRFILDGREKGETFFIAGPWRRPVARGEVRVRKANLMFPFDESQGEGNPIVANIIDNFDWDVKTRAGKDTRYVRQFQAGVYVNMEVNKSDSLDFNGVLKDSTFRISGRVESTRGEIEYFDLSFRVDKVGAEFTRSSLDPIVYGKAWTVIRDTTRNVPTDVYLTLVTTDKVTNQEVNAGRWDRISIKLSSEFPTYEETERQLMATLGYSSDTIDEQAKKAVGSSTDNFLLRPLLRPIERQLERRLALDVVRFSYAIAQNFLDSSFNTGELGSTLALLRSSRLILGKYLTGDLYLLYRGELKTGIDYQYQRQGVGLEHVLGLEYRLNSKWLFQMEYDYNTLFETRKDDKKIWLRHSFPF